MDEAKSEAAGSRLAKTPLRAYQSVDLSRPMSATAKLPLEKFRTSMPDEIGENFIEGFEKFTAEINEFIRSKDEQMGQITAQKTPMKATLNEL